MSYKKNLDYWFRLINYCIAVQFAEENFISNDFIDREFNHVFEM